jgi:hypothetical protein
MARAGYLNGGFLKLSFDVAWLSERIEEVIIRSYLSISRKLFVMVNEWFVSFKQRPDLVTAMPQ